jgi:hypothetical protein
MHKTVNEYSGPYNGRIARLAARLINAGSMTFEEVQEACVAYGARF